MQLPKAALAGLLAILIPAAAGAASAEELRAPLLRGEFDEAAFPPAGAGQPASRDTAAGGYYLGLAAFARQDYPAAIATLATVAEQHSDKPVGLRAAVVATLALSRNGDNANACQYASVVLPLTGSLSPIWRVWVEEAQRSSGCAE